MVLPTSVVIALPPPNLFPTMLYYKWFDWLLMIGRIKPIPNSLLSPLQLAAAFLAFCAPLAYTRF